MSPSPSDLVRPMSTSEVDLVGLTSPSKLDLVGPTSLSPSDLVGLTSPAQLDLVGPTSSFAGPLKPSSNKIEDYVSQDGFVNEGVVGFGSFFLLQEGNTLKQCIVSRKRVKDGYLTGEVWFIENRNWGFAPKNCFGISIALNKNDQPGDTYHHGCILSNTLKEKGFYYLKIKPHVDLL